MDLDKLVKDIREAWEAGEPDHEGMRAVMFTREEMEIIVELIEQRDNARCG